MRQSESEREAKKHEKGRASERVSKERAAQSGSEREAKENEKGRTSERISKERARQSESEAKNCKKGERAEESTKEHERVSETVSVAARSPPPFVPLSFPFFPHPTLGSVFPLRVRVER